MTQPMTQTPSPTQSSAQVRSPARKSSPLVIIFTTVLVDLIGFGMVIPLIGLYGRHYGAAGMQLSILGGI
jgi:hypothetical protein